MEPLGKASGPNLSNSVNSEIPQQKPFWLWPVIIIVALVVVAGVIFGVVRHFYPAGKKVVISNILPKGYQVVVSGSGNYPPGFPTQLVFDLGVKPFHGDHTITGSGQDQKSVEYYASSTPDFQYNLYKSGLLKANWKLSVDMNNAASKVLVFNYPVNESFQVIITPYNKGAEVKLVAINIK